MTDLVRICPICNNHNPVSELRCLGVVDGVPCSCFLISVAPTVPRSAPPEAPHPSPSEGATCAPAGRTCLRGHPAGPDDLLCPTCGEILSTTEEPTPPLGITLPDGWELATAPGTEPVRVRRRSDAVEGILRFAQAQPATAVLQQLTQSQFQRLLDAGTTTDGQSFQIWEHLRLGSLASLSASEKSAPAFAETLLADLSTALLNLERLSLQPPDLAPTSIWLRSRAPMGLALGNLANVCTADPVTDLAEQIAFELTRYSAPETFVGTRSSTSAWWSLGVILLEALTAGRCFDGLHDRAFLLSVVTHGLPLPADIPPEWRILLRGLLTRDHLERWSAPKVQRWLGGDRPVIDIDEPTPGQAPSGPPIRLNGMDFFSPERFALAAADAANWNEAQQQLTSGAIATWLRARKYSAPQLAELRRITSDETLDNDCRMMTALLVLNSDIPLCYRGEIVSESWVLREENRARAYVWLTGALPSHLSRLDRQTWFVRLRERADRIHVRIRDWELPSDEEVLTPFLLQTATPRLYSGWQIRRRELPESPHRALSHLIERRSLSDEDLIVLLCAPVGEFRSAEEILGEAAAISKAAGVKGFRLESARPFFDQSRQQIMDAVGARVQGFARSGIAAVDEWADAFRLEGRISLAQALVLLSVPVSDWQELPEQQYVHQTLIYFQRRLLSSIQHGPLARFVIGKTSRRIDVMELATRRKPADRFVQNIVERGPVFESVDPEALSDRQRDQRLRRMVQDAAKYRRETGINPLYFGFPFIAVRDDRPGQAAKTRLLPILLWPVQINTAQGVQLGFDGNRDDGVRVNLAIEGIIGSAFARDVEQAAQEIRQQSSPTIDGIVHVFATLATARSPDLESLRAPDAYRLKSSEKVTLFSGAFFNCDFSAQTISEDLQHIAGARISDTALAAAILTTPSSPTMPTATIAESDTYFVTDADPSQKSAVLEARKGPGLVVQGPPGTGKSQTIVNIVSDCLGRGERVLVVCQKQAALQVVAKRLRAEGLEYRFFVVEDATSDRRSIIQAIRDQIGNLGAIDVRGNAVRAQERLRVARRLEDLEARLDIVHAAPRAFDPRLGLTYREIITRLIESESSAPEPVSVHRLRGILTSLDLNAVTNIANTCAAVAALWLASRYEGSPLQRLRLFQPTTANCNAFESDLGALYYAARAHEDLVATQRPYSIVVDPGPLSVWLVRHADNLQNMSSRTAEQVAHWGRFFSESSGDRSTGVAMIAELERQERRLSALDPADQSIVLQPLLLAMNQRSLGRWASMARHIDPTYTTLRKSYSPLRLIRTWRGRRLLRSSPLPASPDPIVTLLRAARLEDALRRERHYFTSIISQIVDQPAKAPLTLIELQGAVAALLADLREVQNIADAWSSCPLPQEATAVLRTARPDAYIAFVAHATHSLAVSQARQKAYVNFEACRAWLGEPLAAELGTSIRQDQYTLAKIETLAAAIPALPNFQDFRARAASLDRNTLAALACLREQQVAWESLSPLELAREIRRTIHREALLGWKEELEQRNIALRAERSEFDELVRQLSECDGSMRDFNRELLRSHMPIDRIATHARWNGVLNLAGANQRTLRQVIDEGEKHGLFHMRPVWLVNPEVASRIFPRRAGMFDVVIFDEASQLTVENALSSLFRAKRFVVSGDEKQLPPTSFFLSRFDSDDDETSQERDPGDDAEAAFNGAAERIRRDRRTEVRTASDLLKLAQPLHASTLKIHYRSRYRELIEFSNAAFYQSHLNVPARHPPQVVRKARPIEIHAVQSVYSNQTNPLEADAIVAFLTKHWRKRTRPSLGVLTFNLKQADLIQEKIEEAAENNPEFARAFTKELAREEDGDDHSFFVKNLENVQGDERDWILISTTFGPDADNNFRRFFGALSQPGGERRLNVAVTRAREKVVIFNSMPVDKISEFIYGQARPSRTRDYLQAYLDYGSKISQGHLEAASTALTRVRSVGPDEPSPSNGTSDAFVHQIETYLREQGIEAVRITDRDAFSFDLGIIDPKTEEFKMGIECDSPHHPLLASARDREIWRPRVLRMAVPRIHRVWSRHWYDHATSEKEFLLEAVRRAST